MKDKPIPVLLDTDIGPDCDDAGAVAVLHALALRGEAEILGMACCATDPWGARCLDAINTHYGRSDIPVGTLKRKGFSGDSEVWSGLTYNKEISETYPCRTDFEDAVSLYRRLLAEAEDGSVVIVAVGWLTNLRDLLEEEPDLVRRKVRELVCMGGRIPEGPPECNFVCDVPAALRVIHDWPTPIVFSGSEFGEGILSGVRLHEAPPDDPVRRAYELWTAHFLALWDPNWDLTRIFPHSSFDQTAVLHAVRGAGMWRVVSGGRMVVAEDGSCRWRDGGGDHSYLRLEVPAEEVARLVDELMLEATGAQGPPPIR